jgi:hypothetical protein
MSGSKQMSAGMISIRRDEWQQANVSDAEHLTCNGGISSEVFTTCF